MNPKAKFPFARAGKIFLRGEHIATLKEDVYFAELCSPSQFSWIKGVEDLNDLGGKLIPKPLAQIISGHEDI